MDAKTFCLGVLMIRDASGYEMRKFCKEGHLNHIHHIGYGSIYPALSSLLEEKKITCISVSQGKKNSKKIYSITDKGMKIFIKSLIKEPVEDQHKSETLFMLFFAKYLNLSQVDLVLDKFLKGIKEKLKNIDNREQFENDPGQKFVLGLGQKILTTIMEYVETNKSSFFNELAEENSVKR